MLFTLYLKEDVDEEGNIKEGVLEEAGVPFDKRADGKGEKYGKAARGEEEEDSSGDDEDEKDEEKGGVIGGGDDDVD